MQTYSTHTLEANGEEVFTHGPGESLAIVDLESYESFVDKDADLLDLMAHLQRQMKALTAVAWRVPRESLDLRLILATDHRIMDRMTQSNQRASASGWVRTHGGQLCLTNHDRLYDCAHDRRHDLLRGGPLPRLSRPRVLNVPPGIYSIHVFYRFASPNGYGAEAKSGMEPKVHSTVILRHYAFPTPRLTPMRLPGFVPQAA
jgi:hypothetical protein